MSNLALSCPGCNLAKLDRMSAHDLDGEPSPLYNPRSFEPATLGWHLHFELDLRSGVIIPRTQIGEATESALRMNDRLRISARRLLIRAGLLR
jgi:hypothetical protein